MYKFSTLLLTATLVTLNATPLLKTGQIQSYDADGNIVTDGSVKDDGYYQAGATRSYSRDGDIVIDDSTGLQWQDTVDGYKPWVTQENYDAGNYQDTTGDTAVSYCSDFSLGGYLDWRLPSIEELLTIVDNSEYSPSLTKDIFNHSNSTVYWSSTVSASNISKTLSMSRGHGFTLYYSKADSLHVQCVRGEQIANSNFLRDDTSAVVTDTTTGLQWQDDAEAANTQKIWIDAIGYCEELVYNGEQDWRLPNRSELLSIEDYSKASPSIYDAFSNTSSSFYWSSTTSASDTTLAVAAYFYDASSYNRYKTENYNVRCVRGGQLDNVNTANNHKAVPIIMYLLN